jgi:hypothetical protein
MAGYDFYQPVVANPNDGENITLCKILDTLSTAAGQEGVPQTGSIATSTGSYVINCTDYSTIAFSTIAASSGTITIQGSVDGVNFFNTTYVALASGGISANFNAATATMGQINSVGLTSIKFLASNLVGSITITAIGSIAVSNIMLDNSIPAGSNVIGGVTLPTPSTISAGTTTSSGTATALGSGALTSGIVITNTGSTNGVYIGGSSLSGSTNGYNLVAGASIGFVVNNLSSIYILQNTGSTTVSYIGS